MPNLISPNQVRYIKLGDGGSWEKECLEGGIIRLGFGTEQKLRFRFCTDRKWERLKSSFLKEGRTPIKAADATNQIQKFIEDDGATLWITFHEKRMFWAFLAADPPRPHSDGVGITRVINGHWRSENLNGVSLTTNRLPKDLTKFIKWPGTSCNVNEADFVVGRINGKRSGKTDDAQTTIPNLYPDDVDPRMTYPEGTVFQTTINAFERNAAARKHCLKYHGRKCCVCSFDFARVYGPIADGFIHVHHLRELSQIGMEYEVDPVKDLCPVCPNCHAVLHRKSPAFSIEEVKAFLKNPHGGQRGGVSAI